MKDKTTMIRRIPIFALALLVLMSGCATAGPAAKSKASAALKSADLVEAAGIGADAAFGKYEEAFKGVLAYAKRVKAAKAAKAKANGTAITEAEAVAALKAAGFEFSKTVFFDGIAVNDLKRITWEAKLVQTGSGADTDVGALIGSGTGATIDAAPEAGEIDWMDVILERAEAEGLELE